MPLFSMLVIWFFSEPKQTYLIVDEKGAAHHLETFFWPIYNGCKKDVAAWHRSELEKMDADYRHQQEVSRSETSMKNHLKLMAGASALATANNQRIAKQ